MQKLLAIGLFVFLGGCGAINTIVTNVCKTEEAAHVKYVTYVAPFRSADRVALEAANYAQISAACLTGDPFKVLSSLSAAAKSLRK